MELILEAWGDTVFARNMLRFAQNAKDMRPVFPMVVAYFWEAERKQFTSEGAYASGGWAPLAPSTVAAKAAAGQDPRILHRTLRLRDSLTGTTEDTEILMTSSTLDIRSKVPYGVYHQSRAPRTRLPRRPPVALTQVDKRGIVKILQKWLVTK